MATTIRPVGDRVVVKPARWEEVTKSGIVIPDTAKEKPQEGTVIAVGGGKLLESGDRQPLEVKEGDAATGVQILRRALEEPLRTIAINGGRDGAVIVEMVRRVQREQKNPQIGYNVLDDTAEDVVEAGVIDAAKVTRSALENAASIAAMILTTEALITDIPEEGPASAMPDY